MTVTRPPNDSPLFPERQPSSDNGAELIPSAEDANALHQAREKEFERVYKSLHRELMAYARFQSDSKETAEDLMQTVWMNAHDENVIQRLGGDLQRIAAYIRTMLHNQAIEDAVHERSVWKRAVRHWQSLKARVREREEPYQHVLACELDAELAKGIRTLPPRCAEVFIRKRYFHMSYEEIAEELSISFTTVAAHMRTAKRLLKEYLAAVGYYVFPDVEGEGKERAP